MAEYFTIAMSWDDEAGDEQRLQFRSELYDSPDHHMERERAEEIFGKVVLKGTTNVLSRREHLAKDRGEVPEWLGRSVITEYDDGSGHATGFHINPEWLQDASGLSPKAAAAALSDYQVYPQESYVITATEPTDDATWLAVAKTVGDALKMPEGTFFTAMAHGDHCHLTACPLDAVWVLRQKQHLKELLDMGVLSPLEYQQSVEDLTHKQL